jgi:hypothetical protein
METEAISAGFYIAPSGVKYPKLQTLTIQEHFDAKTLKYPKDLLATFPKAPRARRGEQVKLFGRYKRVPAQGELLRAVEPPEDSSEDADE